MSLCNICEIHKFHDAISVKRVQFHDVISVTSDQFQGVLFSVTSVPGVAMAG